VPVFGPLACAGAELCTHSTSVLVSLFLPSEDEVKEIQQEIAVLSQIRSPYVTRFISAWLRTDPVPRCLPPGW
jgi:hypothetical protein